MKKYSLQEYMALVKSKINDGMYDRTTLLSSLLETYLSKLDYEKSQHKPKSIWLFEIAKYEKLARQLHQLLTKKPTDERIRKTGLYLFARDINRHDLMPTMLRHLKSFRARSNTPIVNKNGFGALITAFFSYTVYNEQLTDELACEIGFNHTWRSVQQKLIRETLNNLLSLSRNTLSKIDVMSLEHYLQRASRLESAMSELDRERLLEAICQIVRLCAINKKKWHEIYFKLDNFISSKLLLTFNFNDKHVQKLLNWCMEIIELRRSTKILDLPFLFDVMLQFKSQLTRAQKNSVIGCLLEYASSKINIAFAVSQMSKSMCDIATNAELSQMLVLMNERNMADETSYFGTWGVIPYHTILINQVLRRPKCKLRQSHIDLVINYIFHDDESIVRCAILAIKQLQSVVPRDLLISGFAKISYADIFEHMSLIVNNHQGANLAEFMTLFDLMPKDQTEAMIETAIYCLQSEKLCGWNAWEVLANLYRIADADQRTKIRLAINIMTDIVIANLYKASSNYSKKYRKSFSDAVTQMDCMLQAVKKLITEDKILQMVTSVMGILTPLIGRARQEPDRYPMHSDSASEYVNGLCGVLGSVAGSIPDDLRSQVIKTLSDLVLMQNMSGELFAIHSAKNALVHYRYAMTEEECDLLINKLNEYSRTTIESYQWYSIMHVKTYSIMHVEPFEAYITLIDFISDRTRKDAITCMLEKFSLVTHLPKEKDFFKTCNDDVRLIEIINLLEDRVSRAPTILNIQLYQTAVSRYNELSALSMIKNEKNLPQEMMTEVTRHGLGVTSTSQVRV